LTAEATPKLPRTGEAKAAELVGPALRLLGVKDLFFMMGLAGPDSPPVRSCEAAGISTYYVRHEEAAAMAAHAYSRLTKRIGVCVTPLGPATTNAITGIANAHLDASPVLLIGGGPRRGDWGKEAYQEQDQMSMLRPVTKAVHRVELPQRIPEVLGIAIQQATSGRKGPVYVELPGDVVHTPVDLDRIHWPDPPGALPRPAASGTDLARVVSMLAACERPVVVSGSGVLWSEANAALQSFVDASRIPLVTTPQSRGVVSEDHPLVLTASRNAAMREADLVLTIGTRANWINGHLKPPRFHVDAQFVVVNVDAGEIGRGRTPEVGIVGDAGVVLEQLTAALSPDLTQRWESWTDRLSSRDADAAARPEPELDSDEVPIHPLRLCREIREWLPPDAIFIVDGHETLEYARRSIPARGEGGYLTTGPNGCMGVGVPMAIGAKVACPDRPVIVLMGDGGFGWNGMEFDTAVRHHLPLLGIVNNNAGFTARTAALGVGRELGFQRYDRVVEALGGYGEFVEKPNAIRDALDRAAASGKPALVNVCTDPDAQAAGGLLGQIKSDRVVQKPSGQSAMSR
jgi:thiamine pyrophosphate-dependent acetolactate synthase large subunit-like protein